MVFYFYKRKLFFKKKLFLKQKLKNECFQPPIIIKDLIVQNLQMDFKDIIKVNKTIYSI